MNSPKSRHLPLGVVLISAFYLFGALILLAFLFINPTQVSSMIAERAWSARHDRNLDPVRRRGVRNADRLWTDLEVSLGVLADHPLPGVFRVHQFGLGDFKSIHDRYWQRPVVLDRDNISLITRKHFFQGKQVPATV